MAWNLSGVAYAYLGEWDEAERRITRYKKLSPLDPHAFFFDTAFIIVALLKRDYESAVAYGRAVSEMNPSFSAACKPYLAALGYLGQMQEAAVVCRRLMAIEPDFTVARFLEHQPLRAPAGPRPFRRRPAPGRRAGRRRGREAGGLKSALLVGWTSVHHLYGRRVMPTRPWRDRLSSRRSHSRRHSAAWCGRRASRGWPSSRCRTVPAGTPPGSAPRSGRAASPGRACP